MVRELLGVAARVALQWAVASLLVANGAAFCFIAAVSARFRLGPPCVLCARVHRLLCSATAAGEGRDALRLLLCDAHLAAVSASGTEEEACDVPDCSGEESAEEQDEDDRDMVSGLESHRVVSIGSEICEQDSDHGTNGNDARRRAGGTDDGPLVSLFELTPIVAHPRDNGEQQSSLHRPPPELLRNVEGGERLTVGQLLSLRAERRELEALRAELDAERRARAAAEERQRELEAQGELDREAARLAMELVHETERGKRALQQQLDACRAYQTELHGGGQRAGDGGERGGRGDNDNNYQSLVEFFPGSAYSSSPDLTNLLKLYPEPGNGDRRQGEGYAPAVTVVDEEAEEGQVQVAVTAGTESSVKC